MSSGHTTTHGIRRVPASSARELHRGSLVSARRQLTAAHSKQVGSRASLRGPRGRLNSYKRLEPEAVLAQILKVSCNRLGAQLFDLSEKGYMVLMSFMLIREHLNDHSDCMVYSVSALHTCLCLYLQLPIHGIRFRLSIQGKLDSPRRTKEEPQMMVHQGLTTDDRSK